MFLFCGRRDRFGYIHPTAKIYQPFHGCKDNMFLYENTKIGECSCILSHKGKFIMKANSRSGMRLSVICQNHSGINEVGRYPGDKRWNEEDAYDVICDEEVWIGMNVTLCPGVHIGRGCIIAAGAVCIKKQEYPPYSIVGGNPAKFIKFKFTLEQQIEHEKLRYSINDRIPEEILKSNYSKFSKE